MEADGVVQIRDAKNRYAAGVLKYAQMGYRDDDYVPSDTDVLAVFRVTAQEGGDAMRPRQRPASPRVEQVVVGQSFLHGRMRYADAIHEMFEFVARLHAHGKAFARI